MINVIECGKLDWNRRGKRDHRATLELELREDGNRKVFSAMGSVYDQKGEMVAGGQCLDEMFECEEMKQFEEIHELWKLWHCNDLTAGSPRQEAAVKAWREKRRSAGEWNGGWDYDAACKMLNKKHLYEDKEFLYEGRPYKYGEAWLCRVIPDDDMAKIEKWMRYGKETTR